MKKILAVLLMIPVLLFGCSKPENSSQESTANTENTVQIDESRIYMIKWVAEPYSDEEDESSRCLHIDDRFEDEALQSAIADLNLTYPLSTDERMKEYACATFNIFTGMGYADPDMIPGRICHYSDGIWCITYETDLYEVCGLPSLFRTFYEIYVSELDGHVIDCICVDLAHEFDD